MSCLFSFVLGSKPPHSGPDPITPARKFRTELHTNPTRVLKLRFCPPPRRGSDRPAQGNALGTGDEDDPCPERAPPDVPSPRDLARVLGERWRPGAVPCGALTGLGRFRVSGFPGRCPGLACCGPFR